MKERKHNLLSRRENKSKNIIISIKRCWGDGPLIWASLCQVWPNILVIIPPYETATVHPGLKSSLHVDLYALTFPFLLWAKTFHHSLSSLLTKGLPVTACFEDWETGTRCQSLHELPLSSCQACHTLNGNFNRLFHSNCSLLFPSLENPSKPWKICFEQIARVANWIKLVHWHELHVQ